MSSRCVGCRAFPRPNITRFGCPAQRLQGSCPPSDAFKAVYGSRLGLRFQLSLTPASKEGLRSHNMMLAVHRLAGTPLRCPLRSVSSLSKSKWACASLHTIHHTLAMVPQVCFTQECQQEADKEFLSIIVPGLLLAIALLASLFRPPPSGDKYFQDPDSQIVFEKKSGEDGVGRDKKGELVYRVVSYTPYPCEADVEGEQIRIDVGKVGQTEPRTFVFEKTLPVPSQLIKVTLPRPLGIVFEEDARRKRVTVAEFVKGGLAEQQNKKAMLDKRLEASSALVGDVFRASTCTTLMYEPASMFGAAAPVPTIGVYCADNQKWPAVATALQRGSVADGPVTLVLERPLPR